MISWASHPLQSSDRTRTLFAQTMQYCRCHRRTVRTRRLPRPRPPRRPGPARFLAAFGCLIGMHFAVRKSVELTVGLLGAFGLLIGLAVAPTLVYYANTDPQALWQAGGATALFIAGFGAVGYSTKRDLSVLGRVGSWALIGLIGFGIVLIFVQIPNGALIYSILGLVIYAGLTLYDFQRLRGTRRRTRHRYWPRRSSSTSSTSSRCFLSLFGGSSRSQG